MGLTTTGGRARVPGTCVRPSPYPAPALVHCRLPGLGRGVAWCRAQRSASHSTRTHGSRSVVGVPRAAAVVLPAAAAAMQLNPSLFHWQQQLTWVGPPTDHGQPPRTATEPLSKVLTTQIEVPSRFSARKSVSCFMKVIPFDSGRVGLPRIQGYVQDARARLLQQVLESHS